MRVLVAVDLSNLYHTIKRRYEKKLNYERYLDRALDDASLFRAIAYGSKVDETSNKFYACLHNSGYQTRIKLTKQGQYIDWNIGIAIEALRYKSRYDELVLGSSNKFLLPLVEELVHDGINVHILACSIPGILAESATEATEITEDLLENATIKTEE